MTELFQDKFRETYGHQMQKGNLQFTVENGYAAH